MDHIITTLCSKYTDIVERSIYSESNSKLFDTLVTTIDKKEFDVKFTSLDNNTILERIHKLCKQDKNTMNENFSLDIFDDNHINNLTDSIALSRIINSRLQSDCEQNVSSMI